MTFNIKTNKIGTYITVENSTVKQVKKSLGNEIVKDVVSGHGATVQVFVDPKKGETVAEYLVRRGCQVE